MAKIVITITDETGPDGQEWARVKTDGVVSMGGTAAEQAACHMLLILSAGEGIPWEDIATEVKPEGESN